MPKIPTVSPATGQRPPPNFVHTVDGNFVDSHGRTLLFRGVNLSGSSKAPSGEPSYLLDGFWESAEAGGNSFISRPLNLDDGSADVHLARLRGWGFNILRYPVAWEALEHEGPGVYDYDFMDYTIRVLRKCKEYGFKVYMDPHQDIWSRYCGGSGAPYWTLAACGMNPRNFTATQSTILHNEYPLAHQPDPASVPAMTWSTNYGRLVPQTLFTLFFAGRDFAPNCVIDGYNIQDYLQSHYIEAFGQLADRIRDAGDLLDDCVIGWDSLNEPSEGFVGYPDLHSLPAKQGSTLKRGPTPTPAQSLRLGMGQAQTVENWTFNAFGPKRTGMVTIDPKGLTIWLDPSTEPDGVHPRYGWKRGPDWQLGVDIWAQHGVWDIETGYVMRPDYFRYLPAVEFAGPQEEVAEVEFVADYWAPHWQAWARRVRKAHPEAIHFVAPPVFAQPPPLPSEDLAGRCAYSAHYYDGLTLVTRHWNWFNADALGLLRGKYKTKLQALRIGEGSIRRSLQAQLKMLKEDAPILGTYPTMIGEIGIPFDMDGRKAYGWTNGGRYRGDYSSQQSALDASLNATDGPNSLSYTVWTYCPDNVHPWGDLWNMEDLSLWSVDDLRPRDEPSSMYQVNGDKSSALLLAAAHRAARSRSTVRLGATDSFTPGYSSQLSLATMPLAANDERGSMPDVASFSRWESGFDFLTDGARAVKAFSRPYPTATIGIPTDIRFDIAKAEFRLVIRVRAEDAPVTHSSAATSRPSTPSSHFTVDDPKAEPPATEVFLPLVHFAADRTVGSLLDNSSYKQGLPALDVDLDEEPVRSRSSETLRGVAHSPYPPRALRNGLAVAVFVSAGRWELDGSTLRWWYPVPRPGEPDREYSLVVARRGGRIVTKEECRHQSFWERLCEGASDCCIM